MKHQCVRRACMHACVPSRAFAAGSAANFNIALHKEGTLYLLTTRASDTSVTGYTSIPLSGYGSRPGEGDSTARLRLAAYQDFDAPSPGVRASERAGCAAARVCVCSMHAPADRSSIHPAALLSCLCSPSSSSPSHTAGAAETRCSSLPGTACRARASARPRCASPVGWTSATSVRAYLAAKLFQLTHNSLLTARTLHLFPLSHAHMPHAGRGA